MIERSVDQALAESVREVLEKMFFVDLPENPDTGPGPVGISAQVIFDGDPPGSFQLNLDMAVAQQIAADFLNEDEAELTPEQVKEVIRELANMICGSVLSRIESKATFRLASPEIADRHPPYPAALLGASFQARVDGGALRAEIRMERPVCPGIDEPVF